MQFIVKSRAEFEATPLPDVPHVVVSISTPGDKAARCNANERTLAVLCLWFGDYDAYHRKHGLIADEAHYFNKEQARRIIDLVRSNPTAEAFVVHCDAGFSRSPGVGAAMSLVVNGRGTDAWFFRDYSPNMYVYRTILDEALGSITQAGDGDGDDHH